MKPNLTRKTLTDAQILAEDQARILKTEILAELASGNTNRARELMRQRDAILRGAL